MTVEFRFTLADSRNILRKLLKNIAKTVAILSIFSVANNTAILFMAALRSRCEHYIFALRFHHLLLLLLFPRLISAMAEWMSTILPHMVWP